jgi:cytochrome c553
MPNSKNRLLKLTAAALICVTSTYASDIGKEVIATKHNKDLTLSQLAEIQPGLGSIMIEFGHRFYVAYYAAKAGNWELAAYQIDELVEVQEVAEATRPKYTEALKTFEHGDIADLQKVIKAKNWKQFDAQYTKTAHACNACHTRTGHPYIQYRLPKVAPKYLRMGL